MSCENEWSETALISRSNETPAALVPYDEGKIAYKSLYSLIAPLLER
jgi:hypothetical protein